MPCRCLAATSFFVQFAENLQPQILLTPYRIQQDFSAPVISPTPRAADPKPDLKPDLTAGINRSLPCALQIQEKLRVFFTSKLKELHHRLNPSGTSI